MPPNFINYILSVLIICSFISFVPLLYYLFNVFSVGWLGLKFAEWLMTITRKCFLYKTVRRKGKAILITGCDTGFGNALARRMDHLGYKVYACCLDPNGESAINLSNESSNRLSVLPLNVTDEQSIQEVKQVLSRKLGKNVLWAVVNNAGITHWSSVDWTSIEEIQNVYDVNATGTLRVTKALLPFLKKSRGRIINVASISGRIHVPTFVGYCMSKSAVIALTTGLRIELSKWGVKAISIEPAFYSTPIVTEEASLASVDRIWKNAPKEIKEEYGEEYLKFFKTYIRTCLEYSCNPNIYEVIDCLEDAITAEDPLSTYFPCSLLQRAAITVLLNLPSAVHEFIQRKFLDWGLKPVALITNEKEKYFI